LDRPIHHAGSGVSEEDFAVSGLTAPDVRRGSTRFHRQPSLAAFPGALALGRSIHHASRRTGPRPPAPALKRGPAGSRRLISGARRGEHRSGAES
jgi:hypothetical protein